ncbi:hypothetical protein FACS1894211_10630 [Clostridia bacterium]|nr:hypothetical protein FACS1894211_10630 [Clostridia bacterium]
MTTTNQGHKTAKRLIVAFMAAALLLSAAIALLCVVPSGKTASAADAPTAAAVPTADYEFTITRNAEDLFEAAGPLTVAPSSAADVVVDRITAAVETDWGAKEGTAAIKINFGDGSTEIDNVGRTMTLSAGAHTGTYIFAGKLASSYAGGPLTVGRSTDTEVVTVYITGSDTEIKSTRSEGANPVTIGVYGRGVLNVCGGKVLAADESGEPIVRAIVLNDGNSVLNVYGGEISASSIFSTGAFTGYAAYSIVNTTVNIYGGKVFGSNAAVYFAQGNGKLNIYGGEIRNTAGTGSDIIRLGASSRPTITVMPLPPTGGEFTETYKAAAYTLSAGESLVVGAVTTYQWSKKDANGDYTDIAGATGADYNVTNIADGGDYKVTARVAFIGRTSAPTESVFHVTINAAVVNIAAIAGVTAPAPGAAPVARITETAQYTGTVTWSESPATFGAATAYTAIITLTAKENYTLTGVAAGFFTVEGASTVVNAANGGVITAMFPATAKDDLPDKGGLSGGAIAGIVIGGVVVVALGGFAIFWFVVKKKTFSDLTAAFKKKA